MPAVHLHCMLSIIYFYISLIYDEYLVNVHFSDIPHTFIPHITLHSAEKKCASNFPQITPWQLSAFCVPHSGKCSALVPVWKGPYTPFTRYNRLSKRFDNRLDVDVCLHNTADCQTITGHFGPKTLRYQDTSPQVPKCPEDTSALMPKCPDSSDPRHFGTKTFRH